jgi:hypothetical protein
MIAGALLSARCCQKCLQRLHATPHTSQLRNNKNKVVRMHVVRNGSSLSVPVDVMEDGRIGVSPKTLDN